MSEICSKIIMPEFNLDKLFPSMRWGKGSLSSQQSIELAACEWGGMRTNLPSNVSQHTKYSILRKCVRILI